ncbi:MAG: JAB domain-containing protein [Candidatus Methanospirareceae archaeon]
MKYIIKQRLKFMMVKETTDTKLMSPRKVYEFMQAEAKIDRECAWVLHFNTKLQLIEKELISMGTLDFTPLHPREVFKRAIINGSDSIMIVHNHPSGNLMPSQEDLRIAERLKEAGKILGIEVRDFIIISSKGYTSFAEEGIL